MTNNEVFSLSRLTDEARLHVIKSFDYPELIALSFISTKTKSLVQSFKLGISDLLVNMEANSLYIVVYYKDGVKYSKFKIYNDFTSRELGSPLVSLDEIPFAIQTSSYLPGYDSLEIFTWSNTGLSFIGWFEHLRSMFTFYESMFNVYAGEEMFDTVAIRNLRTEWKSVDIDYASLGYTLKIFELFSACAKALSVRSINNLSKIPQKFAIQNYDDLNIRRPFTLDDALVSNTLELTLSNIEVPDLNCFIRNWVRGSNPRLTHVKMYPRREIIDEKLLKGVQHHVMPENLERVWNSRWPLSGGFDFRNKNGIPATLTIMRGNFQLIQMFIWN